MLDCFFVILLFDDLSPPLYSLLVVSSCYTHDSLLFSYPILSPFLLFFHPFIFCWNSSMLSCLHLFLICWCFSTSSFYAEFLLSLLPPIFSDHLVFHCLFILSSICFSTLLLLLRILWYLRVSASSAILRWSFTAPLFTDSLVCPCFLILSWFSGTFLSLYIYSLRFSSVLFFPLSPPSEYLVYPCVFPPADTLEFLHSPLLSSYCIFFSPSSPFILCWLFILCCTSGFC